ncbi:MAG: queuosine salvage family protein [Deltaproteobacteria bacterium]|nr:MAG: queuosine salvage family protein [Deltaproteobacteria bacterium]
MGLLSVLSSCLAVVEQSQFVQIDAAAISHLLNSNLPREIAVSPQGPALYHYYDGTGVTAEWIFVLDTVNHCFWPEAGSPLWTVHYGNEALSGYWALAVSLKRAMEERIPITQAETLATLDSQTLAHIFRGSGKIPLFQQRLTNLREAGQVLMDRFQGSFMHVLEEAGGSAVELVHLLAAEFASFNDSTTYHGNRVYFFKRAQLLVQDLWTTFSGDTWGDFVDLEKLTAFADYKLPQVLRHLGIIRYEIELAELIQRLEHIPPGSPEEVEIRAATIWAVELLRQELGKRGQEVTSAQLDCWLWHLGQENTYRFLPYHRTRTIFY